MKLLMEKWNSYLQEAEGMKRVSKAIMVNDEGKVLILKRAPKMITKDGSWKWDLPGGHAERGEKDIHALAREVKEETKVTIVSAPSWFLLDKNTRFYILRDWDGEVALSDEHSDYKWVNPKEVKDYDLGRMYTDAIHKAFNW